MNPNRGKSPAEHILTFYEPRVKAKYANHVGSWPVLSGYNVKMGSFQGWLIIILTHTGIKGMVSTNGIGEISASILGVSSIDKTNKELVRKRLEKHFTLKATDAIIFVDPTGWLDDEIQIMLQKHEYAMGMTPMKIFLSHKGADKPLVREFKKTLEFLGFDPWLDEDAMHAGAELERSLLKGFNDSCAAVFFVTPNYKDENYLASEIDYAIQEKRKKGERFAIITLVLGEGDKKGLVPDLLHRYVWKEPQNDLEALREVLKALPVRVGDVYWKN
ncbi:toll/interleukin-1 receptor domain-containing protein [Pontibacter vulgaris]|uniref:toll/interleukin-1 receptor domain-containing protein n=1 Tax=Pontibacter vulgaris TaxID=2905679 RepID=UPI001FA7BC32|nr:toll/interleukin-1 receptor domain-containing protein [Pontibacter vulgaris]